ncbi:bifunctional adenosylcobinamide kinase/adenosylcobinamide-phosphate guanylyltransferase [Actibacterium atlanticum]|nr:bifunctional adenosylcobinamide kinase/adenosylcobinamide-phosphate guanylyltransferase [Actibacterium atlanticum]
MSKVILYTGGARSGKSTLAERHTLSLGSPAVYVATAEVRDAEMGARVALHQARRGAEWNDVQEPFNLLQILQETDGQGPRLVDCLTLWLSNMMLAEMDWEAQVNALALALPELIDPVVLVTNEVGAGIVPENALARRYRDASGLMNQMIAAQADEVYMAVCGLPMKVKPND